MLSSLEQILADAVLDADIYPPPDIASGPSNTAMITGATGFLGRYVLARLLQHTDQDLILLARSKADQTAQDRVKAILAEIDIDLGDYGDRVQILEGDVGQDDFGLDPVTYQACANAVVAIYHRSAAVDWVRDYGRLRRVNVEGVRHMIRFACTARRKRIVFSSSIAVCMFNTPHGEMSEYTPVLPHIADMPLGYARSKAVAESLLHQCADRGVPVTVVRPPLISGHSISGHSNPSDIFAALLEASIVTGQGPDTDWIFDITPVDYVAQVLTDVPQGRQTWQVLNLKQGNAHSWENLLTWINLHGYRVRRVATDVWIQSLFGDAVARGLMLYSQRQYFAGRPPRAGESAWVRPFEAYLADSYATVDGDQTVGLLAGLGIEAPDINIDVLYGYFRDLRRVGVLPERGPAHRDGADALEVKAFLAANNARRIGKQSGIMNQLAATQKQQSAGVWVFGGTSGGARQVVKVAAQPGVLRDQSAVLASTVSPKLGELFRRFGDPFELEQCGLRERAFYENPPVGLRKFLPQVDATDGLGALEQSCLVMEYLPAADRNENRSWIRSTDPEFTDVIEGMASVHAAGFAQKDTLEKQIKPVTTPNAQRMLQMLPLWEELAKVAAPTFARFGGTEAGVLNQSILGSLADWWLQYELLPRTLIHNDFNPRNFVLRHTGNSPRLCLYDWEIAAIGPPQRDLAELLCFTWSTGAGVDHLRDTLEKSRHLLRTETGHCISRGNWCHGFRMALQYFFISRLPLYTLIKNLTPLPFLPRLIANSEEIFALAQVLDGRISDVVQKNYL